MTNDDIIAEIRETPLGLDFHERYWLFSWIDGEPRGGISDFDASYSSPEIARIFFDSRHNAYNYVGEIFDSLTGGSILIP